jgi:hypothetical protein
LALAGVQRALRVDMQVGGSALRAMLSNALQGLLDQSNAGAAAGGQIGL